jgi:putative hemolysin
LKSSRLRFASATAAAALLSAVLLLLGSTNLTAADAATSPDAGLAAQYCQQQGGAAVKRVPYYGTNGSNPLRLAGSQRFCQFTSADDGSRIHVLLDTLYTPNPSLAALAYYAEVQFNGQCNGNPASCYCTQLGGSDQFGGTNGAGGGWVKKGTEDLVLEACIFPDMSTIDSWGLFYHSAGIVRGKDLNGVLRYPDPFVGKK